MPKENYNKIPPFTTKCREERGGVFQIAPLDGYYWLKIIFANSNFFCTSQNPKIPLNMKNSFCPSIRIEEGPFSKYMIGNYYLSFDNMSNTIVDQ